MIYIIYIVFMFIFKIRLRIRTHLCDLSIVQLRLLIVLKSIYNIDSYTEYSHNVYEKSIDKINK
jgi:hypothetical protein